MLARTGLLLVVVAAVGSRGCHGFSVPRSPYTECSESSYYIDQRLTSESIFYDHFNYVLTTWIESFPNNVAKEDFRYDLLKLVNSQETSEDKCGYSRAEFTDISLNNTVASVEANKDLNEIWEDVEIHLRFLGYSRSSVIQHFVADFIEYNKDKTPEKLEKLVDPWEKKVKTFISKTVPRRLQERAEVFWAEFTRSHTAGVKEKCMRFLPDTSIVEWKTVIEEYKNAFVQMKTDCVPNGQKMEHPQFKFFVIMGILGFCLSCVCICRERRSKVDKKGADYDGSKRTFPL